MTRVDAERLLSLGAFSDPAVLLLDAARRTTASRRRQDAADGGSFQSAQLEAAVARDPE